MRICNENKIYMKYSLFWWLNFGTLKQFMMTMPFLTSIQLCLNSLYSDLHLKILLLFVGNQLKAEKVRLAISPLPLQQSKIWLNCAAAGRRPANLRKRNFLVSDNTTDFEKTTIQAHSAVQGRARVTVTLCWMAFLSRSGQHAVTTTRQWTVRGRAVIMSYYNSLLPLQSNVLTLLQYYL